VAALLLSSICCCAVAAAASSSEGALVDAAVAVLDATEFMRPELMVDFSAWVADIVRK
jgi:hypothetical protein